jgi:hypothetical protein
MKSKDQQLLEEAYSSIYLKESTNVLVRHLSEILKALTRIHPELAKSFNSVVQSISRKPDLESIGTCDGVGENEKGHFIIDLSKIGSRLPLDNQTIKALGQVDRINIDERGHPIIDLSVLAGQSIEKNTTSNDLPPEPPNSNEPAAALALGDYRNK